METIVDDLKKKFLTLVKGFGSGSASAGKVGSGSASKRSGSATLVRRTKNVKNSTIFVTGKDMDWICKFIFSNYPDKWNPFMSIKKFIDHNFKHKGFRQNQA